MFVGTTFQSYNLRFLIFLIVIPIFIINDRRFLMSVMQAKINTCVVLETVFLRPDRGFESTQLGGSGWRFTGFAIFYKIETKYYAWLNNKYYAFD